MKKMICSVLVLAMMLCLVACGSTYASASESPADSSALPEAGQQPEDPAPYGIPLWASADDVDLAVLFSAYNQKSLLQHADSVEKAEIISDAYSDVHASYSYCRDGDRYVENILITSPDAESYIPTTTLNIYDTVNKERSVSYQKGMSLTETPLEPEAIDTIVATCILPFNPERYTFEAVSRSVSDGHYVIAFRMHKAGETGESAETNDGVVEIDPATSLILKYTYQWNYRTPEGSDYASETSGRLAYNTGKGPDYSLLP